MAFGKGRSFMAILSLLTLGSLAALKMQHSCSRTSAISGKMQASDDTGNETFVSTVIHTPLKKEETLCYDLMVEKDGKVKSGRRVFISLLDIQQNYEVKFTYNFSIPTMDVKCVCDCPGGRDHCNSEHESEACDRDYGTGNGKCIKKHTAEHHGSGCGAYWRLASVCCDISVSTKRSSPEYVMLHVDNPKTVFTLEMGFVDDEGNVLGKAKKITVTSHAGEIPSDNGDVIGIVGNPFEKPIITPGLYFMKYDNKVLYTGEPINALNERSLQKLGWYKFDKNGRLLPIDLTALRQALSISVTSCYYDTISWSSSARYYQKQYDKRPEIGHQLNEVFQISATVGSDGRSLSAKTSSTSTSTSPIFLHARLNVSANVVFRYGKPKLNKFSADIILDKFGNRYLRLFLVAASGKFHGKVELTGESFTTLVASKQPIDATKEVKLSHYKCPSQVSLHAEGHKTVFHATASCKLEDPVGARIPKEEYTPISGGSTNTAEDWLSQIHEWLRNTKDSIISWVMGPIKVVAGVVAAILGVILFVLILLCIKKCGCSFFPWFWRITFPKKGKPVIVCVNKKKSTDEVDSILPEYKSDAFGSSTTLQTDDKESDEVDSLLIKNKLDSFRSLQGTEEKTEKVDFFLQQKKRDSLSSHYSLYVNVNEANNDDSPMREAKNDECRSPCVLQIAVDQTDEDRSHLDNPKIIDLGSSNTTDATFV